MNPLILCHGLCSFKASLPLLELLQPVPIYYPYTALVTGMYARGPPAIAAARQASSTSTGRSTGVRSLAVKRPRPESCSSSSTTRPADPRSSHQPSTPHKQRRDMSAAERRENRYQDSVCNMCSDSSHTVRHPHFSSSALRRQAKADKCETYRCPVCNFVESVTILPTQTRRIVIADSTLHAVWDHTTEL